MAGIWAPARPGDELAAITTDLAAALAHRGPDAGDTWTDPEVGVGLAHRRLAVVGLGPEGAQPMTSRSGRWVLTYNGELYGVGRVRSTLEAEGVRFRGTSDTEVLVEALDAWGPERALVAVDGMFAFGAWDRDEHRLVLARDRMGEKPLVYGPVPGGLAFASELGALRRVPGFDAGLDPEAVALFLRFKSVPAPWTIHPGTKKLRPGHWVEVRDGGRTIGEPRAYWSHADVVARGLADPLPDDETAIDALDHAIGRAVARQLHAEVPLGAFLSGGIDSSLVATVAAEQLATPLRTFTIGSPDPDLDESDPARQVAQRLGTEHTELVVRPDDALAVVPDLAGLWDEPFGDSSQLPTLLVARLARRHVTVALSGDGGDELFGGYNRHTWLPAVWRRAGRVPAPARRVVAAGLGWPSPAAWDRAGRVLPASRRPRLLGLKAQKMALVVGATDASDAYGRLTAHWQGPAPIAGATDPATLVHRPDEWPAGDLATQLMAVDAVTYLPDDVLVKVDRATMSIGLEARVPLLDREVVELAARLPLEAKIRGGTGKWALRRLLDRRHPTALFDRPKAGFGIPIAPWLRDELRPWAEDLLSPAALEAGPLADAGPVRAAWAEHRSGRADRSYELWDVLMLQSWHQTLVSGG